MTSKIYIYIISLTFLVLSCVKAPVEPIDNGKIQSSRAVYILCEGLWGMDNATLSRYDFENQSVINDYYSIQNPGLRLGDLADDIVIKGDTIFVTVSTTKTIEVISAKDGKSFGRIKFEGNYCPRRITIVNDTSAYVTDLYNDAIYEFNPSTIKLKDRKIKVGPAPEGIVSNGQYIFVANSGYGDYRYKEQKAGTISVVDINLSQEITTMDAGIDAVELVLNKNKSRLYAAFYNLPSQPDSLGGIIEYDANTLQILRRWKVDATSLALSLTGDTLLFLNKNGVQFINISSADGQVKILINNTNQNENWYSLVVNHFDNNIWIGNARNYQIEGEVLILKFSDNSTLLQKFSVGINPGKIVFYGK